jgi:hypothetical protein
MNPLAKIIPVEGFAGLTEAEVEDQVGARRFQMLLTGSWKYHERLKGEIEALHRLHPKHLGEGI